MEAMLRCPPRQRRRHKTAGSAKRRPRRIEMLIAVTTSLGGPQCAGSGEASCTHVATRSRQRQHLWGPNWTGAPRTGRNFPSAYDATQDPSQRSLSPEWVSTVSPKPYCNRAS
jgi:hypothetical protein